MSTEDSTKLDLILNKLGQLESREIVPEEQRLHELAFKYWGLTEDDIKILETSRIILDRGTSNNHGKTLRFIFEIVNLAERIGIDNFLKYIDQIKDSKKKSVTK